MITKAFPNLHEIKHPLLQHKLSLLRDVNTGKQLFNKLVYEITLILGIEATRFLPLRATKIRTPLEDMEAPVLAGKLPVIVPILRAGLGMVNAMSELMPAAKVGHIGLYRDEKTFKAIHYYFKIPKDYELRHFFICDPMLATGGTAVEAIKQLRENNVSAISLVCIIAAPEGVQRLLDTYPEVPIYTASLDRQLNASNYILPGLGDAGDRLYGTLDSNA